MIPLAVEECTVEKADSTLEVFGCRAVVKLFSVLDTSDFPVGEVFEDRTVAELFFVLVDSFILPVAELSETRDVVELFFVLDAFKLPVVDVFEDRDVIELFFVLDAFELETAICDEELARAAAVFTVEVAVLFSIDEALKLVLVLRELELV